MTGAAAILADRYPLIKDLLTRRFGLVLAAAFLLVLAIHAGMFVHSVATSKNFVTLYGPVLGGDFVVFDTAGEDAAAGKGASVYDPEDFRARLQERFPGGGSMRLYWQYPPTMFLAVFWLAFLPYLQSYCAWLASTGAVYISALRPLIATRLMLLALISSPAFMQAFVTGQTGFLTGGLLAIAVLHADKRPLVAGFAAGLLTVKPQLGLLLPFAFIAGGCWRAFGAAAATSALIAVAAALAFGLEPWRAFIGALGEHAGRVQSSAFPLEKLVSVYGGAAMVGAPANLAMALHIAGAAALLVLTIFIWRRRKDSDLRLAALAPAALLAAPNAAYYEAALAAPALLVIARRGFAEGWRLGERPVIAAVWAAPMLILGDRDLPAAPTGFLMVAATLMLATRRCLFAPRRPT